MNRFMHGHRGWFFSVFAATALTLTMWACSGDAPESPVTPEVGSVQALGLKNPSVQNVMAVQDSHTPRLMSIDKVVGTATSWDEAGQLVIKIYTEEPLGPGLLPTQLDGIRVIEQVTGPLGLVKGPPPMDGGGSGGVDPKAKQSIPVKMGTSGGWRHDLANGFCCGGTLGSLITNGPNQYVLSNYHVLYADIVDGGNGRTASAGDPVVQPALIDVGCVAGDAQDVATLVDKGGSLPGTGIDAGIAKVISGQVDPSGEILSIGIISSATAATFVGQGVKKMGRTTGLGRGTVDGINATVSIGYANECAGGSSFTETYTGQIIITNDRCKFLDGGDSGSLMVEDVSDNPRAVGLLFAGSTRCNKTAIAIANPINDVLDFYASELGGTWSMVGN